ncbi:hypothetical protein LRS12_12640 [Sphingomonas sp. J344]|uniref:hypothetical protein n=1 Tax=Sphingomonas sp. J344 TaxID=2898434 RepID=UPI002150F651|nr:hypothetical protein [Sphingomonas sp. J344]MCR5871489.1 hypothetical protein [Sphingomonas sp. J344]
MGWGLGAGAGAALGGVGSGFVTGSGCVTGTGGGESSSGGPGTSASRSAGASFSITGASLTSPASSVSETSIGVDSSFSGLGVARKPTESRPNSATWPITATPIAAPSLRSIATAISPCPHPW